MTQIEVWGWVLRIKRPAAAVGPVHVEPYLNRWVSSPVGHCVPSTYGLASPNGSQIPGHVVLAHVDWNLTHSAGLPSAYPCAKENASITRRPVSCVTCYVSRTVVSRRMCHVSCAARTTCVMFHVLCVMKRRCWFFHNT